MEISSEKLVRIYRDMCRTRRLDETINRLLAEGHAIIQHAGVGQEVTPIAACATLQADDVILPYHRGWAWAVGKGMEPRRILAELLGKKTGYGGGKSGPHLADYDLGIMGRPGIQGAHIAISAGVGLALKQEGRGRVGLCFFGDSATNSGAFHEGLNMACVWKVPMVYICENNRYGAVTPTTETTSARDIFRRAASYDIEGWVVDGNDVHDVYSAVSEAVDRARSGEGPTLIEARTYRLLGHNHSDDRHYGGYRSRREVDWWQAKDPLFIFRRQLIAIAVLTEAEADEIDRQAQSEAEQAAAFALHSDYPEKAEITDGVYA